MRGSEPISVTWLKGQEVIKEDGKIKMSFSSGVAVLIIPDVQISFGGKYTCLAENEAGSQTSVGELIVKGSCRNTLTLNCHFPLKRNPNTHLGILTL